MKTNANKKRLLLGLLLIFLGIIYLLNNFGLLGFVPHDFLFRWQTILILLGLFLLIAYNYKTSGITLIIVGMLGFSPKLWPLILIGFGIYLVLKTSHGKRSERIAPENRFTIENFFHGCKREIVSQNLTKGEIATIFGGCKVDLSSANFTANETLIEVFALFGSLVLTFPKGYKINVKIENIFGSLLNETEGKQTTETEKTIIIKGALIFSSGKIKSF